MHTPHLKKSVFHSLALLFVSVSLVHGVTINPVADAYVRSGTNATFNYGGSPDLVLKLGLPGDNFSRETYITFDLATIGTPITSAKLKLYGSATDAGVTAAVYGLASPTATWLEGTGTGSAVTGINWNNKLAASSTAQATATVSQAAAWNEWQIASYLAAEKTAGRNLVTLVLKATVANAAGIGFGSRTAVSNQPKLEIVSGNWTAVNETDNRIRYTGYWAANIGGFKEAIDTGAFAEFEFTGTGIRYYAKTAPYMTGVAEISIDGVVQTTVINTAALNNEVLLYENTSLLNSTHTIRVRKLSGNFVTAARFDVLNDGSGPSAVSITAPSSLGVTSDSGYILPDALVNVTANATNATSLKLQLDGVDVPGAVDNTAPYSIVWDAAQKWPDNHVTPVGNHTLTVVATNAAGTMTSAGVPVLIELFAGVNTHAGQWANITDMKSLSVDAGANLVRDGALWRQVETVAGTYNWSSGEIAAVENLANLANAVGIRTQTGLCFGNSLYPSPWDDTTTAGRVAFANYGKELALHFGNNIRLQEIWNEPTGGMGVPDLNGDGRFYDDGTASRYYAIAKAAYPKIKEGNPNAIVTGPTTMLADPYDLNFLTAFQSLGGADYIDWLDVHTYLRNSAGLVHLEDGQRWLKNSVQSLFPNKPVIVTEFTLNSVAPLTELNKADSVARFYMSLRTLPNIRGAVWYQLIDFGDNRGLCGPAAGGYVRHEAFYAFKDVAPLFRRALYYGRAKISDSYVWLVKFKDTTGDVYAAWREEDSSSNLSFTFTASAAGNLQVRDVNTTSTTAISTAYPFVAGSNSIGIPLSTRVKFIRVPSGVTVTPANSYFFVTGDSYGFSPTPIP